jgi:hypothetical protein
MSQSKHRRRQNSPSERQAAIAGRLGTSQTGRSQLGGANSTYGSDGALEMEEIQVGGGSGRTRRADRWTKAGTFAGWAAVAISVLVGVGTLIWYASKADSAITGVQTDVGDVKKKVEKISEDVSRQGGRIDGVENSVSRIERALGRTEARSKK